LRRCLEFVRIHQRITALRPTGARFRRRSPVRHTAIIVVPDAGNPLLQGESPMPSKSEKVEFIGSQGALLAARIDLPAVPPSAFCLFAHCFTCSRDTRASTHIATALAERGFAVLRIEGALGDA
jgi:hypothetical protein